MDKIIRILILLLLSTSNILFAQNSNNKVDENGLKQGFWKKYYPNGTVQYTGNFVDNKPIGEFKRYNQDGTLKVSMIYRKNSNKVYSTFFYPDMKIHSEGIYIEKLKDSTWNYYAIQGYKINEVNYVNNKKHGTELKFYENGNISEKSEWAHGINHGLTMRYYESGKVWMRILYSNGIMDGEYNIYGLQENILIQGQYKNNKREGKWLYFKNNGHVKDELNYKNGIPDNHEELERLKQEELELLEKNKGKIKDPRETMYNT